MTFSFYPDPPERERPAYAPRKRRQGNSWRAPEHTKMTLDMKRDFPRDDRGIPLPNSKKDELVLDKRPTILRPVKPVYFL